MSDVFVAGAERSSLALQVMFVRYARTSTVLALIAIVAGLFTAWGASYVTGGSRTAVPHLFYLPVILAAVRFSWRGALTASVTAGLLAGPVLPADVATGAEQPFEGWALRLVIFTLVALLVSWLLRGRTESISSSLQDSLVSSRLVRAVHRGEVEVYYQPILDMGSGRFVGLEALSRWNDPRRGPLSPDDFIARAERTGAIAVLDQYVLSHALRQARRWSQRVGPVQMSVNLSATRFADDDLVTSVGAALADAGLPAHYLQLEITESAIIGDVEAASVQIAALRRLGVRVAIDDFGAGQCSLAYFNQFEVDTVKIDRGLVSQIGEAPQTERLLSGLVRMFHALGLNIVAEGIEKADQYVHLQSLGCDLAQGFFVGRPAPAKDIEELLRRRGLMADRATAISPPVAV